MLAKNAKNSIAFIGGGNITNAMVTGLTLGNHPKKQIVIFDPISEKLNTLVKDFGIIAAKTSIEAINQANVVVLAVKPHLMEEVCIETADIINNNKPLVISVAAATRLDDIFTWFNVEGLPIVRTMPNLASSVGKGTTVMFANKFTTLPQYEHAYAIFSAIGKAFWIENESDFNKYSPLVGCGPAYLFLLIEALEKAAVARGIPKHLAAQLALSVVFGAAQLATESNHSPEALRKSVTTPNGLTEASLKPIIGGHYFKLFEDGFEAAEKRGSEIEEANRVNSPFSKLNKM
jgi:pyrroline-5-carboxylate reductase